jgi:gamma-glutamylcysteine synthetase
MKLKIKENKNKGNKNKVKATITRRSLRHTQVGHLEDTQQKLGVDLRAAEESDIDSLKSSVKYSYNTVDYSCFGSKGSPFYICLNKAALYVTFFLFTETFIVVINPLLI